MDLNKLRRVLTNRQKPGELSGLAIHMELL